MNNTSNQTHFYFCTDFFATHILLGNMFFNNFLPFQLLTHNQAVICKSQSISGLSYLPQFRFNCEPI